jgi:hypothetical protein
MGVGVEYIPNLAYCLLTVCSSEELLNPVRGPEITWTPNPS